jgi:hypothetical protein
MVANRAGSFGSTSCPNDAGLDIRILMHTHPARDLVFAQGVRELVHVRDHGVW